MLHGKRKTNPNFRSTQALIWRQKHLLLEHHDLPNENEILKKVKSIQEPVIPTSEAQHLQKPDWGIPPPTYLNKPGDFGIYGRYDKDFADEVAQARFEVEEYKTKWRGTEGINEKTKLQRHDWATPAVEEMPPRLVDKERENELLEPKSYRDHRRDVNKAVMNAVDSEAEHLSDEIRQIGKDLSRLLSRKDPDDKNYVQRTKKRLTSLLEKRTSRGGSLRSASSADSLQSPTSPQSSKSRRKAKKEKEKKDVKDEGAYFDFKRKYAFKMKDLPYHILQHEVRGEWVNDFPEDWQQKRDEEELNRLLKKEARLRDWAWWMSWERRKEEDEEMFAREFKREDKKFKEKTERERQKENRQDRRMSLDS